MSYDLRRLRLHGLISRLQDSNTYLLTPEGIRVAVFYTKLGCCAPCSTPTNRPHNPDIRHALRTLENAVNEYVH